MNGVGSGQHDVVSPSLENFRGPQNVRAGIRREFRGHGHGDAMTAGDRIVSLGLLSTSWLYCLHVNKTMALKLLSWAHHCSAAHGRARVGKQGASQLAVHVCVLYADHDQHKCSLGEFAPRGLGYLGGLSSSRTMCSLHVVRPLKPAATGMRRVEEPSGSQGRVASESWGGVGCSALLTVTVLGEHQNLQSIVCSSCWADDSCWTWPMIACVQQQAWANDKAECHRCQMQNAPQAARAAAAQNRGFALK